MLFNSYEFIFAFLPLTFAFYFIFNRLALYRAAQLWLVVASLWFYAWWNPVYIFVIIISILLNFFFGQALLTEKDRKKTRTILGFGVGFNLAEAGQNAVS